MELSCHHFVDVVLEGTANSELNFFQTERFRITTLSERCKCSAEKCLPYMDYNPLKDVIRTPC
jgi:hypothetical protein